MSNGTIPDNETKDVYTTGDIARICRVSSRTVVHWIDGGRISGYRLPGSNDRRVLRDDLIRFLRSAGMPTRGLDGSPPCRAIVLCVACDGTTEDTLREALGADSIRVEAAATAFDAGRMCAELSPACVVVDLDALGRIDAAMIAAGCAALPRPPKMVAVSDAEMSLAGVRDLDTFDAFGQDVDDASRLELARRISLLLAPEPKPKGGRPKG